MSCPKCGKPLILKVCEGIYKEALDLDHWNENTIRPNIYYKEENGKKIPIPSCHLCGKPELKEGGE